MNKETQHTSEYEDRLLDQALRETLGEESPPDLTEQILSAAGNLDQALAIPSTKGKEMTVTKQKFKTSRLTLAIAATILIGTTIGLLLPDVQIAREVARRSGSYEERLKNQQVHQRSSATDSKTITASPGSSSSGNQWGFGGGLGGGNSIPQGEILDRYREPVQSPVPIDDQSAVTSPGQQFGISPTPDRDKSKSTSDAANELNQQHQQVTKQLKQKFDAYNQIAENLEGSESEISSQMLNRNIGEVRIINKNIATVNKELLDIELARQQDEQTARSPAAIDQAVKIQLDKDPILLNYQNNLYAIEDQIRSIGPNTRGAGSNIKRLYEQKQKLTQDMLTYEQDRTKELKSQFRNAPNDSLSLAMNDYITRREHLTRTLADLQAQKKLKESEIRKSGNKSGEIAVIKAEIDQLRALEQALDAQLRNLGIEQGKGPGDSGDKYTRIYENPFIVAEGLDALSTFSIDVDTASYANVRNFLMRSHRLPPPNAVRIEELVNYFDYDYSGPTSGAPFAAHVEVAACPWQPEHRLARIGIKGHEIDRRERPQSNLVFLIDVSGSMNNSNKLPLLISGMKMLTRELGENDQVAIVVYASSEGLALPSTRGDKQETILAALDRLRAGGSTAGGAGIQLAYYIAQENFIEGGINRVILATDGDFNVGTTSTAALETMAETKAKESGVFLTVLGFGRGNLNDSMMEAISGKGNGNYHYIDNTTEARKVLVEEMSGTLVTIAKDVKIQVEFNPAQVAGYRLIGYENRMLEAQDFNNDKKDAGEIGAGHTVTALYEIVPAGVKVDASPIDDLKYQQPPTQESTEEQAELLTLKLRYKKPNGEKSTKLEFPVTDQGTSFAEATQDFQFAASVAGFGMLLRNSQYSGNATFSSVLEIAEGGVANDPRGYRAEFMELVRTAKTLVGE